jgi:hypothetical protein
MCLKQTKWCAPEHVTLPDFIIGGAMKSGTTSLHAILNQHPDVFIPKDELHFFDMDNFVQHPLFNVFKQGRWYTHNLPESPEFYWKWYSSHFQSAAQGQLIGEDSTTYLASPFAAKRIALQNKDIKVVIMLRHPTARAYSHYWHMVKAGKAMFNFEDTIRFLPHNILGRSAYLSQLQSLFSYLPKAQVKVLVFEEFLADKANTIKGVCDFLSLDYATLPSSALTIHANQARIPRFIPLHLLKSRLFQGWGNNPHVTRFPSDMFKSEKTSKSSLSLDRLYNAINPLVVGNPPKIQPETKRFLDDYFYRELQGLNELLGQNILSTWFDDVNSHK